MTKHVIVAALALVAAMTGRAAAQNWTGFYVGGNVTYASGQDTGDTVITRCCSDRTYFGVTSGPDYFKLNPDGWLAGGQIGFNWNIGGSWIVGIEADYQGGTAYGRRTNSTSSNNFLYTDTTEQKLSEMATLRARAGFSIDRVLYFFTGGAASAIVKTITSDSQYAPLVGHNYPWSASVAINQRHYGWTVGGGTEIQVSRGWSLKLEYLFVDLGHQAALLFNANRGVGQGSATLVSMRTDISEHLFRVGVNYQFGGT